ncbi:MAG TPA: hypothetical protein VMT69_15785 [Kineosporiaceae bacterium]|nr:hypothetical protein [Kineosporiaceae bacterium]
MTSRDGVRRRVERLRATNPAAADLATLLSTAVRIEPALVRRMRLLLPRADVGAELDLWSSDVVASASPLALSLDPACAEVLRADLAAPAYAGLRERAGDVLEAAHGGQHWSLRLEERINRLMVRGDERATQEAERLLFAAIAELRATAASGPTAAAEATGLARWLLAALGRIPRALAGTEAAVVAGLGAGTQLDGRYDPPSGASAATEAWMPWLLAAAAVETRTVSARFFDGTLTLNEQGPGEVVLVLPGTDPLVLDVTWHDGSTGRHERLRFRQGKRAGLHVGADEVTLQALSGERWRLARPRPSDALTTGLDFSAVRARLRPCLGRRREVDELVQLVYEQRRVVAVTGEPRIGKSALAGAALDTLERIGYLVAEHVYGVQEGWDGPGIVAASLEAKLRGALGPALDAALEVPSHASRGRRRALLVVNTRFADRSLPDLEGVDLPALTDVLSEAESQGFEVERLADARDEEIRDAFQRLVLGAGPDDELLLYVATYGLVGAGSMSLAAADSLPGARPTGVPVNSMWEMARKSAARSVALMLDCRPLPSSTYQPIDGLGLPGPQARGGGEAPRIALLLGWSPASLGPDAAFVLARPLIEGLGSGDADLDGDGAVSVGDLARYAQRGDDTTWVGGYPGVVIARVAERGDHPVQVLDPALVAAAGRAAQQRRLRGVVLALDDVPATSIDELPIGGPVPPGVTLLLTSRARVTALEHAFAGDQPVVATLNASGSEGVCREILAWRGEELTLAFGQPPGPDELIRLVDGVPGRLAALVDWILDQPVGRARLPEAPPTLVGRPDELWDGLGTAHLQALGVIAAARQDFTVDDLGRVLARTATVRREVSEGSEVSEVNEAALSSRLVDDLVRRRFVRAEGPAGEPETFVKVTHRSVAEAYAEAYDVRLRSAHGLHALAFPHADPSAATPYQLDNAADHHVRAGLTTAATFLAGSGGYLDLRRRATGVDTLDADLAALTPLAPRAAHIRTAMALCRGALEAEPDRFAELVDNALRAFGEADLAEAVFHQWRRSPLRVRAVHDLTEPEILWRYEGLAMAAVQGPPGDVVSLGDDVRVHPGSTADPPVHVVRQDGPALLALADDAVVVAGYQSLTVLRGADAREEVATGGAVVRVLLADAQSVAAGLEDGTLLHVRLGPGKIRRRTLLGHAAAVTALVWHPAGLVSAGDDGTVRVWDTERGVARLVYRGHTAPVVALVGLDTGGVLTGDDQGRLRWWDPETGRDLGVLTGNVAVTAIRAVPGGAVCATADGAMHLWQLPRGGRPVERRLRAPGPQLLHVAVAGRALVSWGMDGVLAWWDVETGDVRRQVRPGGVASPVYDLLARDHEVVVVHAGGMTAYPHPIQASALTGNDAYLEALTPTWPSSDVVFAGTSTGVAQVSLRSGETGHIAQPPVVSVTSVAGTVVAVNAEGGLDVSSGDYVRVVPEESSEGPVGAWLQTTDGNLVRHGSRTYPGIPLSAGDAAFAAVRAGQRRRLAIGDRGGAVRLLDPDQPSASPDLVRLGAGAVTALALTPSGRRLVAGDASGTVRAIDLAGTRTPVTLGWHPGGVTGLAALPSTEQVASAGADGALRWWDLENLRLLAVVGGPVGFRALAAAPGVVVARDQEGRLWVLDADDVRSVPATRDRVLLSGSYRSSDGQEYSASFTVRLRTRAPVELRGVRLLTEPPVRGRPVRVSVALDGVPVQVDGTGRLAVPRQFTEDADVRLEITLNVTTPRRTGERNLEARLTLWTPESGEDDLSWSSSVQDILGRETPA